MALFLALGYYPQPVQNLDGVRNPDGTVTLTWTLPADPAIVGVTVVRQRLAGWDEDVYELWGPVTTFWDQTAHRDRSYGYWVFTRDGDGDLSEGEYVEVWSDTHHEDVDHECHALASAGAVPAGPLLLGLLAAGLFLRRRA